MSNNGEYKLHFETSEIENIDRSVLSYVKGLSLATTTNKGFKEVPVVWGSSERSFQTKNNKEIRDEQGLLVLPIISIRRSSFAKNLLSPGIFQGHVPEIPDDQGGSLQRRVTLYHQKTTKFANADAKKKHQQKNFPTKNKKIVERTITVPMPVNVELMYEITIRTEYQQQMNDLMIPFITKPGTINFVSLKDGPHRYEGFIQPDYSSNDNLTSFADEERKFETKITLKVIGYLMGEGPNREKPYYSIRENFVEVKLPRERLSLGEIPEHEYGAYYGLGNTNNVEELFENIFGPSQPGLLNNVPASSFFGNLGSSEGSGAGNITNNVVTTENFTTVLSNSMVIREVLKNEDHVPGDLINFTTAFDISPNTEQVMVNGLPVPSGAEPLGEYTVQDSNTIVFNESVEDGDHIMITYIKSQI